MAHTETHFGRPTVTREELIAALTALPAGTPILGYAADEYVNIDGLSFSVEDEWPAAVIETRNDYDTRQW